MGYYFKWINLNLNQILYNELIYEGDNKSIIGCDCDGDYL